jgi:AbrB family looped-hinge helix DNA binding protein
MSAAKRAAHVQPVVSHGALRYRFVNLGGLDRFDIPAPVTTSGHAVPGRAVTGFRWYRFSMEAVIDQAGRVVLPKPIRDALGLLPGTKVDITPYGAGAQLLPAGRTARLVEEDGVLVADAETPVDDDMVFALIDAGRK